MLAAPRRGHGENKLCASARLAPVLDASRAWRLLGNPSQSTVARVRKSSTYMVRFYEEYR